MRLLGIVSDASADRAAIATNNSSIMPNDHMVGLLARLTVSGTTTVDTHAVSRIGGILPAPSVPFLFGWPVPQAGGIFSAADWPGCQFVP